jgi:hypothetical protein
MSNLKKRLILHHHQEQSTIYFYLSTSFDDVSHAVAVELLTISSLHTHTYSILQVGLDEYMFHTTLYGVILQMSVYVLWCFLTLHLQKAQYQMN